MSSKQPNFILFITDQHRADYLGCYGHPIVQTPHIDGMAQEGVRFERFYVNSPVCMPNRASLMTCRVPSSHGVRFNGIPLSVNNVTFVELLRDAGYETALIGKSHLQNFSGMPPILKKAERQEGYHQPSEALSEAVRHDLDGADYRYEEPGFWSGEQPSVRTPFYGFDHVELVTGHGDEVGGDYKAWLLQQEPNAAQLIGPKNQLPHDYSCPQAVRTAIPPELYSTRYIAERAESWLRQHKDSDRPFFLMVSWPDPHHPFNPPGHYWNMYDPAAMPVPDAFLANDWTPPPHVAGVLKAREDSKANLNGMNAVGCSAQEAREAQALTCGMITMIDDAVGQVLNALQASGRKGDTVTIFTSDHGEHLGDHRLLFKGAEQYEQLIRVPFIWSDPIGKKYACSDKIGQTHDIGASILERAKIEKSFGMQGQDIINDDVERRYAIIQYSHQRHMDGFDISPNVHSVRDQRFRLSIYQGLDWGELYDLDEDPGEFYNLWDNLAYQTDKYRLLEGLARAAIDNVSIAPAPTGRA